MSDNTPIIIGIGQITEPVPENLDSASSHADLAAAAARIALEDAGISGASDQIDTIVGVRTFADSSPAHQSPYGGPTNFPRAVGQRVGADPEYAIYANVGGQTPQALVGEFAEKLHQGKTNLVLLAGGEVIATIKAASRARIQLDWSEQVGGQLEDRGLTDGEHLGTNQEYKHHVLLPIQFYGFMEQARRAERKEDLATYTKEMGTTLAALSKIAAANSHAQFPVEYDAETLIEPTDRNRMLVSPYTRNLVAKDSVNQGAAVLLTTVGKARSLGVSEDKWVYLHGYCNTRERTLLERTRLGFSKGMELSLTGALAQAGRKADEVRHFDIYSCFPIVVNEARDVLELTENDNRQLSQTGGMAFFGGPGNNYSTHGLVSLVASLRNDPGSFGLLYANGGWMSKHATGVYSTQPPAAPWQACDSTPAQSAVDADPRVDVDFDPQGEAVLESYIINYSGGQPVNSVVIGRLPSNRRFYAWNAPGDTETLAHTVNSQDEILGSTIYVAADPQGNRYAYTPATLEKYAPPRIEEFQDSYEFCKVERKERILLVTIDRPEVRNALNPEANQELENIFNAYEKDKDLWVAIITGAGNEAFSSGNDLKAMASGSLWIPETGFGGLTSRTGRTKPIIAAVNGLALGGGLEVAMACDMIVAADHATFSMPEVKLGVIAAMGGIQRVTRQIGLKKGMEMLLTGISIGAQEALDLGLINQVIPGDDVLAAAEQLAQLVCEASPVAVRSTMQLLNETAGMASIDEAVTYRHNVQDNLLNSEDFYEGSRAFAEKRKPRWSGR